jgi:hypothetical protein
MGLMSSPSLSIIRLLLFQSCLAEVVDDSIGYGFGERKCLGIALQGELGIDPENLCGRGPGLFLPPQPQVRDGHVDVRKLAVGLPLERFFALLDGFLILPRVAISDG